MKNRLNNTVQYLCKRLIQSPLLLGWIILGTIIEVIRNGYKGFIVTIINLILLTIFTIIIKVMSNDSTIKVTKEIRHPKFELFCGVLFYVYSIIVICTCWGQAKIPYISLGITNLISIIEKGVFNLGKIGIPEWFLGELRNASVNTALFLVPIVILFICLGYGFKKMGFVFTNFNLILILLGLTIVLGLPFGVLFQQPFYKTIITFFITIFINALQEELIYRGYLLPRFEVILKNSINALVIVAILFSMSHVPSELARGMNIYDAILSQLSIVYPTGLIWGYLYLKTRSIVPGIAWHASNTILGIMFGIVQ